MIMERPGATGKCHPNLVALLGLCLQPQALVYEWVDGGDLKALLNDPTRLATVMLH